MCAHATFQYLAQELQENFGKGFRRNEIIWTQECEYRWISNIDETVWGSIGTAVVFGVTFSYQRLHDGVSIFLVFRVVMSKVRRIILFYLSAWLLVFRRYVFVVTCLTKHEIDNAAKNMMETCTPLSVWRYVGMPYGIVLWSKERFFMCANVI